MEGNTLTGPVLMRFQSVSAPSTGYVRPLEAGLIDGELWAQGPRNLGAKLRRWAIPPEVAENWHVVSASDADLSAIRAAGYDVGDARGKGVAVEA
jgi:hypothetical protein